MFSVSGCCTHPCWERVWDHHTTLSVTAAKCQQEWWDERQGINLPDPWMALVGASVFSRSCHVCCSFRDPDILADADKPSSHRRDRASKQYHTVVVPCCYACRPSEPTDCHRTSTTIPGSRGSCASPETDTVSIANVNTDCLLLCRHEPIGSPPHLQIPVSVSPAAFAPQASPAAICEGLR